MKKNQFLMPLLIITIHTLAPSCENYDDGAGDIWEEESFDGRASLSGDIYQAEDHSFQSGCSKRSNHSGYTGSGFMDFGGDGTLVEWNNVNVSSAGQGTLTFRYANGGSGDRRCQIEVNGPNVGNIAFQSTGGCGWSNWSNASIKVNLKSANNKIRVKANSGSGGPNVDAMAVGSSGGGGGDMKSNLQVKLGGTWKGVCCNNGELEISSGNCSWTESGRVLKTKDLRTGNSTALNCPENGQRPKDCDCTSSGERMHGTKADGNVSVKNSLRLPDGAPIYPNSGHETCIDLVNGELQSRWTSSSCPNWRLINF